MLFRSGHEEAHRLRTYVQYSPPLHPLHAETGPRITGTATKIQGHQPSLPQAHEDRTDLAARTSHPHPKPTQDEANTPSPPTCTGQPVRVSRSGMFGPGGLVQGYRFETAGREGWTQASRCGQASSRTQVRDVQLGRPGSGCSVRAGRFRPPQTPPTRTHSPNPTPPRRDVAQAR